MEMMLLHAHYDREDSDEYYMIVDSRLNKADLQIKIETLEAVYGGSIPPKEQSPHDMLDFVVFRMREQGYTLIPVFKSGVVRRNYDWS